MCAVRTRNLTSCPLVLAPEGAGYANALMFPFRPWKHCGSKRMRNRKWIKGLARRKTQNSTAIGL